MSVKDLKREACLIDGEWLTGDYWIDVDNPATGEVIGCVWRVAERIEDYLEIKYLCLGL